MSGGRRPARARLGSPAHRGHAQREGLAAPPGGGRGRPGHRGRAARLRGPSGTTWSVPSVRPAARASLEEGREGQVLGDGWLLARSQGLQPPAQAQMMAHGAEGQQQDCPWCLVAAASSPHPASPRTTRAPCALLASFPATAAARCFRLCLHHAPLLAVGMGPAQPGFPLQPPSTLAG